MPKKPVIKYTNRSFDTIKADLVEHAKRYYPTIYDDFSTPSIGGMLLDSVSYVGDMLSFYLDFQVNESILETSSQYDNVRRLASQMGYNFYGRPSAFGMVDIYIIVPANTIGTGPNTTYIPIMKTGAQFSSENGEVFKLLEDVDFNLPNTPFVPATVDGTSNKPLTFAMKRTAQVKSGNTFTRTVEVGPATRFLQVEVGPSVINEIISVFDSDGREYYQVDNLTQEIIYLNTTNPNATSDNVPQILKPHIASRRFIMEQNEETTYLRFGYGSDNELETNGIVSPSDKILKLTGKNHITDTGFDPGKFLNTNKFGVAPANTTLTITYSSNLTAINNLAVGSLNNFLEAEFEFPNSTTQSGADFFTVRQSVEVSNPMAITQNSNYPTIEEIKYRAYAKYSSQNRTVTKTDYESFAYQMPPSLGSIKRVSIVNDPSATNKKMIMYVISENNSGDLVKTNDTVKNNLRTWINKNKMISDKIEIRDTKIINIGFNFSFTVEANYDYLTVLANVKGALADKFSEKLYIGESFYITEIYKIVNRIDGVIDTIYVEPLVFSGGQYSPVNVMVDSLKSPDGTYLKTPKNCILEIKNFSDVVKGTVIQ